MSDREGRTDDRGPPPVSSGGTDSSDAASREPDIDPAVAATTREELRTTFDYQVERLREIDNKAIEILKANLLLIGIVVLLPVDRRMLAVAAGGTVICLAGIGRFLAAYPTNFNVSGPDATAEVVGIYSVGLVLVVAATAAALIAHRIEQASESVAVADDDDDDEETVTDAEVEADIERELDDAELSWGGVEKRETRRLDLDTSALDDVDSENLPESSVETRTTDSTVNDAVSQLEGLQGGTMETASGESTDDQAAALSELKQERQTTTEPEPTFFERIRDLLAGK